MSAISRLRQSAASNRACRSGDRTEVIHTTSSHLFWDPSLDYGWIPAKQLKPGMRLKTPDGQSAVVVDGSIPANHDGWMVSTGPGPRSCAGPE